ncbi:MULTISPECIES: YlxR family protein [unclassified Leucobacter]|uniref:YlxR family protein n=1 Tax=unclassified Leucobacter TaxID=2621730 RepID=UPI00165D39B3|nr:MULTISPECIES: YlxR family protein [unclassified Leucobacter]MBC9928123.1 YlxR family protein [Leucobacter sp. cx-169]MBC9936793.1 YlxR family protein [Leucobacter sp. cx-87]
MDPVRSCVGCHARANRAELLRVVQRDGQVLPDDRAVLPGRGAWVHPTVQCVEQAVKRGAFSRALRSSGKLDTSPLQNRLKSLMDN